MTEERDLGFEIPDTAETGFTPPPAVDTVRQEGMLPSPEQLHQASLRHISEGVTGQALYKQCRKTLYDNQGRIAEHGFTMYGVFTKEYVEIPIPRATMKEEILAVIGQIEQEHYACVYHPNTLLISWDPAVYEGFQQGATA